MTETVPEDWDDVVETIRRDLGAVSSGDPEDEEVRAVIDEVWAIVDAAEGRIGAVDVDEIGEVLGVDAATAEDAIDVGSIDREFITDDPDRAAGLGRLVALINLDEATDYDVGRLWRDDTGADDGAGADEERSGDEGDSESLAANADVPDPSMDDAGEQLRSQLGDALSQFRDRIQDAREGLDGSSGRGGGAEPSEAGSRVDDSDDETGPERSSSKRRSRTSSRSSTALSTIPSARHDMDGVTHFSTMPGRRGRSRTSTLATSEEDRDDRSGSAGEE